MPEKTGRVIVLRLPVPPSVNNAYANTSRGRVKTTRLRSWLKEAGWIATPQLPSRFNGPLFTGFVAVDVQLARPPQRDLDNCAKALLDLLTSLRVWKDDNQVHDIRLRWAPVEGCQVTIRDLPQKSIDVSALAE